ncbi:hypothetical protein QAD02_020910 [Eretmocerus hayati]|uniref:Uncharacterized protein n=1 Tax=Eretmocerus hayati TaxID=131215 RepID=A0ACC2PNZ8_9HYME|nr:hypothetical protein QAD02_020910 [Eretmocerus hayati]
MNFSYFYLQLEKGRRNTVARDSHTFKRSKRESGYKRSKKQRTLPTFRNEEPHSMLNKPKKFFKSRNMHTSSGKPYGRVVRQSNHEEESDIGNTPNEGDLHGFVSSKTAIPIRKEVNPPIVLRICKGTSRLVSAVDSANPHTSPAISVSELRVVDTEIWNSEQQRDTSAMTTQGMHGHNTSESLSDPQVKVTRACAKPFQSDGTPRTTPDELLSPNLVSEHECVDISIPYRETLTHKSSADLVQGSLKNNSDPPKRIIFAAGECSNPPKELSSLRDSSPKPQIESLGGNYRSKCDGMVDTYDIPTQDHEIKKPQQVSMCNEESQRETLTVLHRRTSDKTSKSVSSSGQSHLSLRSRISLNRDPVGDCSQNCDESDCISNSQNRDRVHASVPTLETDECTAISNRSIYLPAIAKKGSIFKTRNTDAKFTGKRRALYKHKWSGGERESKFVDQGLHGDRVIRARSTGNDLDIVIHKEGDSEPHSSQFSFKADLESGGFDEDNSSEADVRGENKEGDVSQSYSIFLF